LKAVKENVNSAMKELSGGVDMAASMETEASQVEKHLKKEKICKWH
jgi:hypothetical protein